MRSSGVERVPASLLRPSDRLVPTSGAEFSVIRVDPVGNGAVRLTTNGEWSARAFTVLGSTMFVRVKEDRRIVMRPDLSKEQA